MSGPIAPGDWVECIDVRGRPDVVKLGGVYLVEATDYSVRHPVLELRGVVCDRTGARRVYAYWFRPVYTPKASLIEQLSQPVDIPADEPVSVPA